ncbi:cobalt transporter CbiM [Rhodobacter maris]|uniref:Cobalt/nickel transport system permease protein n=1 Tax=Rhodobacter maris TaxID=446682 RepID=A0A285S021_9RHOB|nr:cobalt transporter CbiM [Rhodobacter maris]SOB99971.1 cobalt/nickel transport system permease protein [Rhodobacter maris]
MHIVDGALSAPVLVSGAVLTAGGITLGLRQMTLERIPAAGVLSASFFVASLIHVAVGPSSVHLILNGLCGLILGWTAFPALFVALVLQAVFFGFGGITVLGVNTLNIALPAVLMGLALRPLIARAGPRLAALWGAIGGAGAIALTTVFVAGALVFSGEAFVPAAKLVFFAHIPVMAIEAVISAAAVVLIKRVKPDLFAAPSAALPA